MKRIVYENLAKKVVEHCLSEGKKFIFISGNGGSGKTSLGKAIFDEASRHGHVNVLSTDDFVVETDLRKRASITYEDVNNKVQTGRYTTSIPGSYFLQSLNAILYNLEKGNDLYHWPKKASNSDETLLLHGDAILTIVEGVGAVFLNHESEESVSIFLTCDKDLEIKRRIKRSEYSNEKDQDTVRAEFEVRSNQFQSFVKPLGSKFDVVLESMADFSLIVVQDKIDILKKGLQS